MTHDTFADSDWPERVARGSFARLRRAAVVSIAGAVGWICFTLLYVAFWAHGYSLFQSIIVIVVSLIVLAGVMAATWVSFGLRWAHGGFD
jgi:hypothetical protein